MSFLAFTEETAQALRDGPCDVVVTGANGWLGRATLDMFRHALGADFDRRVIALGSCDAGPVRALESWVPTAGRAYWLWHYAFLTKDRAEGMAPADYERANRSLRERVLAWVRSGSVRGVALPSSGAVYDYLRDTGRNTDYDVAPQHQAGRDALREYGRLKVEDEQAFGAECIRAGVQLVVARVFNLSGPYINKVDRYALASMIRQAIDGGPVVVRAARPVLRSYYYVGDYLELCARLLLRNLPMQQEAFDVAAEEVVELGELARRIIAALHCPHSTVLRPAFHANAVADQYVGNPDRIRALENAVGLRPMGLEQQIVETARYLRDVSLASVPFPAGKGGLATATSGTSSR